MSINDHSHDSVSLSPGDAGLSAEKSEYLKYLSIGFYILAGFAFLCGAFPIIHFVFGIAMLGGFFSDSGMGGPEALFGCFFVFIALFFIFSAWAYAFFAFKVGKALVARERHTLCMVVAGTSCLFAPLGTLIGVFTIILLVDPEVKRAFGVEVSSANLPAPQSR